MIDAAGSRNRRRGYLVLAAALLIAMVALAQAVLAADPTPPRPPGDDGFLNWPARGDRASDPSLLDATIDAWDAGLGVNHRDVRMLYGGDDSLLGAVAVVEGRSASGELRLAVLAQDLPSGGPAGDDAMRLVDDRPAPNPSSAREVSLVTRRLPDVSADGAVVLALAEPQADVTGIASWAWDSYGGFRARDLAVEVVPASATAKNTKVTVKRDGASVYDGLIDETAESRSGPEVGDAHVHGLPKGMKIRPVVTLHDSGVTSTSRTFVGAGGRALRIVELRGDAVTRDALPALVAPEAHVSPANPRGRTAMFELMSDQLRGFVWLQAPGVGYAVIGRGDREIGIDAYHVAHAIDIG